MPRLSPFQLTSAERRIKISKRNGWRHAVFVPKEKLIYNENYKGQWREDRKHGKGAYLTRNGWLYEGDWEADAPNGYGILSKVSEEGDIRKCYAGDWRRGKRNGIGSNWYFDGSYYEGNFCDNKRQGYGRIWHNNSDYYQGTWRNDRYDGTGMFVQGFFEFVLNSLKLDFREFVKIRGGILPGNGNRYEGEFLDGKKDGRGIFYHLNTGQIQRGFWKNNICLHSVIEDVSWRQSAVQPTAYPIPEFQIYMCNK